MAHKEALGDWHLCGDYGALNYVVFPDCYPIIYIQDLSTLLQDAMIFSKIDLIEAYHQIKLEPENIKIEVSTNLGLFECLQMLFSVRNAAQTFQIFMDQALRWLHFCYLYTGTWHLNKPNKECFDVVSLISLNTLWTAMKSLCCSTKLELFKIFLSNPHNGHFMNFI